MNKQEVTVKIPCDGPQHQKMLQDRFAVGTKLREGVVLTAKLIQGSFIVVFEAASNMILTAFGVIHDFCVFDMGQSKPTLIIGKPA